MRKIIAIKSFLKKYSPGFHLGGTRSVTLGNSSPGIQFYLMTWQRNFVTFAGKISIPGDCSPSVIRKGKSVFEGSYLLRELLRYLKKGFSLWTWRLPRAFANAEVSNSVTL